MAEKLKITILNAPITVGSYDKKKDGVPTGEKGYYTKFTAQSEDGKTIYAPCQAWGDRKVLLEDAVKSGSPVEVDSVEFNKDRGQYDVKFPWRSGREAGYRKDNKRPWVKPGYEGKPMSPDRFWDVTADAMTKAVKSIKKSLTKEELANLSPAEILESARSLVATFWICSEKNMTFVEGCAPDKPAAAPESTSDAGSTSAPASDSGKAPESPAPSSGGDNTKIKQEFIARISECKDKAELDAIRDQISASGLPDNDRSELHFAVYEQKKALNGSAGGGE